MAASTAWAVVLSQVDVLSEVLPFIQRLIPLSYIGLRPMLVHDSGTKINS